MRTEDLAPCRRLAESGMSAAWDDYCRAHDDAVPAHFTAWGRVVTETLGHECYSLLFEEAGRVRGVLPLFLRSSVVFGRHLVSVPAANTGGILADDEEVAGSLIRTARGLARDLNVDYMELRGGVPEAMDVDRVSDRYVTVVIDLGGGEESVWSGLKANVRRHVRRAREAGLEATFGRDMAAFYPVYAATMKRLRSPPFARGFFEALLVQFGDRATIAVARHENEVVAVDFLVEAGGTVHSLYAGSTTLSPELRPNHFLVWSELKEACARKHRRFDLGRSTVESGSLEFKRAWGGEIVPLEYGYVLHRSKTIPNRAPDSALFRTASRIWGLLPGPIVARVGPRLVRHLH